MGFLGETDGELALCSSDMDFRLSLVSLLGQATCLVGFAAWEMGRAGYLGSLGDVNTHLLGLGLPHTVILGSSIFSCSVWL